MQIGRQELALERHLKLRLEKLLDRKLVEQQAASDKEAAAALQAASHVASLEHHIQSLKVNIKPERHALSCIHGPFVV